MADTRTKAEKYRDSKKLGSLAQQADTDEAKYAAAVEQARNSFGGENASRGAFKDAIDRYFAENGGSKTGREMRGENAWTDFIQGINDVNRGINTGIGTGMDFVFDNTVGNLAGLFGGEEAGKDVKNWFSGEDLALIPDIASDVLLTASGWGIPLVVTKEAARNADDFYGAFTGRDAVTREALTPEQRAARGTLATLGTGLSILPGVGKARSIAKMASGKEAKNSLDAAKKSFDEALSTVEEKTGRGSLKADKLEGADELEELKKIVNDPSKSAKEVYRAQQRIPRLEKYIAQNAAPDKTASVMADVGNALKNKITQPYEQAVKRAQDFADMSTAGRVGQLFKDDMTGFAQALRDIPQTVKSSRDVIAGEKELKKLFRSANKLNKPTKGGKKTEDLAGARQASLELAAEEAGVSLDDVLKKAGIEDISNLVSDASPMVRAFGGRFKTGLPVSGPQVWRTVGDVLGDIGARSNASLLKAQGYDQGLRGLEAWMKNTKYAELENTPGLKAKAQKALLGTPEQRLNPTGARQNFAATLGGQAASMPLIPLAFQAEYGGDYIDNLNRVAEDIRKNGAGRYIAATFPVGAGRMYATNAIPSATMRFGSYYPFGALRAKDTVNQFQDLADQDMTPHTLDQAYRNITNRK